MPTVKLNKEIFEGLVGKKLPIEQLKDRISMLGTDLESIEGNIINVEVFPNRPDMLSEQGFARAFSSFIGAKIGLRKYDVTPSGESIIVDKSLDGIRPCTACAIIKGIKFDDEKIKEVIQIQEKLHITFGRNRKKAAIGIYPMEHIKFPITFRADKPEKIIFRPLEYPTELTGAQILTKHPAGREYAALLEGKNRFPYFIDADGKILSMPPIINSHDTGRIGKDTTEVFIECSGFELHVLKKCINIIVTAMADMGGSIHSLELIYPDAKIITPDLSPLEMALDIDYINRKLGLTLKKEEAFALLERMGYGTIPDKDAILVPAYRADILHPVDIIEDVAIAYGYENFVEEIPNVMTIGREEPFEVFKRKIASILSGLGLLEVFTYHIASKEDQTSKMGIDMELVELENALNVEFSVMRGWIIPSLLDVYNHNRHNEYPQDIFNIGTVFKQDSSTETNVLEQDRLAVSLCSESADFTRIRQVFDYLMDSIGLEYDISETEHGSFISGRAARISVAGKDVAYIGEIHPQSIAAFGLQMPISAFELNLTVLFSVIAPKQ